MKKVKDITLTNKLLKEKKSLKSTFNISSVENQAEALNKTIENKNVKISDQAECQPVCGGIETEKFIETNQPQIDNDKEEFNANFFIEDLTPEDEILTFQCPENFSEKSLLHNYFDSNNFTDLNGDQWNFQILKSTKKELTCIIPHKSKKNETNATFIKLPVAGHILIRNHVNISPKKIKFIEHNNDTKLGFSSSLTVRHPLLGIHWKKHLSKAKKEIKKRKKLSRKSLEDRKKMEAEVSKRKGFFSELALHKKKKHSL